MSTPVEISARELSIYDREWLRSVGRRRLTAIEKALADPELVSLRCEIAKIDLRIAELDERAQDGETRDSWVRLAAMAKHLLEQIANTPFADDKSEANLRNSALEIQMLADAPLDEFKHWDEIKDLIERRRRLAATEQKWEKLQKVLIPASRLTLFFDNLHEAIYAIINDEKVRLALLNEVRVRLNGDARKNLTPIELPPAYVSGNPPNVGEAGSGESVDEFDDTDDVDDREIPLPEHGRADGKLPLGDSETSPDD